MANKLIIEGDTKSDVRFRLDREVAESVKALKNRVREKGMTLTLDEEVQRSVMRLVRQANKELDEIESRGVESATAPSAAQESGRGE